METIVSQLDTAFRAAIRSAFGIEADPLIGVAQNEKFGDYQSNAPMGLAKLIADKTGQKTNPRAVAELIKARLDLQGMAQDISIAGPGFINVRLSPEWLGQLMAAISADKRLGVPLVSDIQTVVVDYSGPNIAKELHVGHLRSTIIGDAIVRVLSFQGHRVIRQNHIGDWGTQFGRVFLAIWHLCMASRKRHDVTRLYDIAASLSSAVKKKDDVTRKQLVEEVGRRHDEDIQDDPRGEEFFRPFLTGYTPDLPELLPLYQMVSLVEAAPEAERIIIHGPHGDQPLSTQSKLITSFLQKGRAADPSNQQEEEAWWKVREATMDSCQGIYDRLGVLLNHADEYGESRYNPMLPAVVRDLERSQLATRSQGAVAVFIDGPDKPPLVIEKSGDFGYLYGTTDLAAIRYRASAIRADRIVYLVDARQTHHFSQVFATAKKAGWADHVSLEHAAFGTMLGEDGRPFKTRSGDTVKLEDLLNEAQARALIAVTDKAKERETELTECEREIISRQVGIGAVKYADLSKDRISDYVFSFDKVLALDGNTAPYLQYAHARIMSIFRRARDRGIDPAGGAVRLESPFELSLAKHILRLGEVLALVSRELKPHHLCTYLYDLSTRFSGFFENCPVLSSEETVRNSRLKLCDLTARTLACGLGLLGIEHPDQM
jgi:arginyl-tRNA synthetase